METSNHIKWWYQIGQATQTAVVSNSLGILTKGVARTEVGKDTCVRVCVGGGGEEEGGGDRVCEGL